MIDILKKVVRKPDRALAYLSETGKKRLPQSAFQITSDAMMFWRGSANRPYIRDLSHWKGEGRWGDESAWLHVGDSHFEMYETLCSLAEVSRPVSSMIEWGPGGGANAVRFSEEVDRIYGVDISEANLEECRRQLEAKHFQGFVPIQIDAHKPDDAISLIDERVDFFLSTAVFQHFPSKEYGINVTDLAYRVLKTGGVAIIQTRYDDGSAELKPKFRDYSKNALAFTSYSAQEYWRIAQHSGFRPLATILDLEPCYAYYLLSKDSNE